MERPLGYSRIFKFNLRSVAKAVAKRLATLLDRKRLLAPQLPVKVLASQFDPSWISTSLGLARNWKQQRAVNSTLRAGCNFYILEQYACILEWMKESFHDASYDVNIQPTLPQFWSLESRCLSAHKNIYFVDRRILSLQNCERIRRVVHHTRRSGKKVKCRKTIR